MHVIKISAQTIYSGLLTASEATLASKWPQMPGLTSQYCKTTMITYYPIPIGPPWPITVQIIPIQAFFDSLRGCSGLQMASEARVEYCKTVMITLDSIPIGLPRPITVQIIPIQSFLTASEAALASKWPRRPKLTL